MELVPFKKKYNLDRTNRIVGLGVTGGTAVTAAVLLANPVGIAITLMLALAVAFPILVKGVSNDAKWVYFRDFMTERDGEHRRDRANYPSLWERSYQNFKGNSPDISTIAIAKAMITGKPLKVIFKSEATDAFGGRLQSGVEIKGFKMTLKEENCPSELQMWSDAYDNAVKLK